MKLYMHPVSTTCRPIRLLIAENGIKCDEETVDILTGAHYQEPYVSLNPNRLVPMLVDDDFRLTEASAILKYLAEKYQLACYPKDLKQRAKVNEMMDWLNTQFYRDFGYGLVYPSSFHITSAAAMRHTPAPSPGDRTGPRIRCRFSTTTGSARTSNISVAASSQSLIISAPASCRSGN